jgi:hypothetical protein
MTNLAFDSLVDDTFKICEDVKSLHTDYELQLHTIQYANGTIEEFSTDYALMITCNMNEMAEFWEHEKLARLDPK